MKKKKQHKEIYIDNTISMWGGHNGEVNFELEDGSVLTFNATILCVIFRQSFNLHSTKWQKKNNILRIVIKN